MKIKHIISFALVLLAGCLVAGCQKDAPIDTVAVTSTHNAISFINVINATDSGTAVPAATTKSGFTAILQQNQIKDASAIDSIKLYYQTNNVTVDSSTLTAANLAATKVETPYDSLVAVYYTFDVPTANLVATKKYTVVATAYTVNGSVVTATFSNLFTW